MLFGIYDHEVSNIANIIEMADYQYQTVITDNEGYWYFLIIQYYQRVSAIFSHDYL